MDLVGGLGAAGVSDVGADERGPAQNLVTIDDLHVSFTRSKKTVRALRGIDLEIKKGEILGLVGESGSGKSVLGLTLLGLLPTRPPPEVAGRAVVCGVDMVAATRAEQRQVRKDHLGAVFQDPMTSLNPTMRVGEQVAEATGSMADAVKLLESVGIPDPGVRKRAFPHQLSGGLRQRVMIAMAVAGNPALIVADEPTTALDVTVQAQILELLAELRQRIGTSIVLVTHDLGVAAKVADRIAVLYGGRLAEVGSAEEIFNDPKHPYTAGLLRSRLLLDTDRSRPLRTLPGEPPDPRQHPPGCPFAPRCSFKETKCDEVLPELETIAAGEGRSVACVVAESRRVETAARVQVDPWATPEVPNLGGPRPAVVVTGVHKRFAIGSGLRRPRLHALRGVDLTIVEGESVALVGESGCGKTTLLRSIAGLQGIDEGSIDLGRGARPQMVFQDAGASLTPWMTIGELIGERLAGEGIRGKERSARVQEVLALVGLPSEVASAKPMQLSGGQRQRVALARSTVVPPEVLLCDEPTSALDVSLAATVLNLIGRLRRDLRVAVLFVTHDLAAARMVADRIAIMYLGRIVELGPADEVCAKPAHPYTRALLATVPDPRRTRPLLKGEPANPLDPPAGCSFHPRCSIARSSCQESVPVLSELAPGSPRSVACPVSLEANP